MAQLPDTGPAAKRKDVLKNEIVGHIQKKEAWIGLGVLEPIVLTLSTSRSPAKPNGKDARTQLISRPLSDEDSVKLQALQLVASFANGGPAFLAPIHAAGVVPAILANICPLSNPPQLVVAALKALTDIANAAALAPPSSPLNTSSLADTVFVPQHFEALNLMLSISSPKHILQSQVSIASGLVSRLCRDEKHQHALSTSGVLDSLATQLARFAVRDGLVIPGAEEHAYADGLYEVFPEPASANAKIGPILEAIAAILGNSKYRAKRLVASPSLMAVFPTVKVDTVDSYGQQPALTAMDYILPSMPFTGARNQSGAQSSLPTPDRSDSRTSSRASLSRFSSAAVWDSPRNQSSGNSSEAAVEDIESPLIPWLIHLTRTLTEYDRLMAAALIAALFKAGLGRKVTRETSIGFLVVPIIVGMIERNDKDGTDSEAPVNATQQLILENAPAVLARLITDSEFLQKAAYDCDAVKVLTKLLRRAYQPVPETDQPKYWSPQSDTGMDVEGTQAAARLGDKGQNPLLAHRMRLREASLKAIGALAAGKEDYRKAFVAEEFVPYVVESLCEYPRKPKQAKDRSKDKPSADSGRKGPSAAYGTNPVSVITAACHVVRMLARSVSVLRTSLVDFGVALPIFQFMTHRDVNVQIAATATVINLVVEVSPVREVSFQYRRRKTLLADPRQLLTEKGVMKVLCEHAHSDNPALRLNALWALKHFVDAVGPELKKACLEKLEPGWLIQLICDDTQDTALYNSRLKEAAGDDFDEDMDMQPLDEPLRWLYYSNGSIRELDASRSTRLRQAEDKLSAIREAELNPMRRARNDDIAIQEQGLDFIRNLIGRPGTGASSETPSETTEMIDFLFTELGQDRLFEILASKLRSRMLHPFSRRTSTSGRDQRVLHPQAKIIVAVIYILVHMAASIPRHRQLVIAQTELLKLLAQQASSKDREVRVALCHLVINLTWQEDEGEAQQCMARATELKRLGFHSKMEALKLSDRDLDVRERAKTAAWQIEQATY
ncbi:LOW QUALITY PROTEIN: armadillo repeat protein [Purpureocillium lavendulum]|uniref:Armadillo repeat protein n=1 Tax=Purpureocillium lavendulum TaxID=1247861 RepID=A0AB34FMT5_9HYPO|nr:LOW QUALITY PROTEIN: armadillo repeat protein [Purpureocillium lavendulum]